MLAMRQLGVRTSGGAEALAIFHQLLFDAWQDGALPKALARIKVDEKNCFGSLEWPAIRNATKEHLPRHLAVSCWKHKERSIVEQSGVQEKLKDRGAEQGDVDGPLECSLTLGAVAAEARHKLHQAQRAGQLPWASQDMEAAQAAANEFDSRQSRSATWLASSPQDRREQSISQSIIPSPQHETQAYGGVADFWYLDDGDILCEPGLVLALLQHFDEANGAAGAIRNRSKTEVIYYASEDELSEKASEWRVEEVAQQAKVCTAAEANLTLGVATGGLEGIEAQVLEKAKVVSAIQTRIEVCQDAQTQHVLNQQSLGVSRVNHILRVHGHALASQGSPLKCFDDLVHSAMDRFFPGLTAESYDQATLSASLGGVGWRRATDVATAANIGALVAAGPLIRSMSAAASHAGLLPHGVLEQRLEVKTDAASASLLECLDEVEKVKAEDYLRKAKEAAGQQWQARQAASRTTVSAPNPDLSFGTAAEGEPQEEAQVEGSSTAGENSRALSGPRLQKDLSKLRDLTRLRRLETTLANQSNWQQLDRLKELRHPGVSHQWLSHLDVRSGSVLPEADYVVNVQKRLGAQVMEVEVPCRLCGTQLDPALEHCETCANPEATRGHYACVRALVDGLKLADAGVSTEPRGLTTTQDRPADILTTAAVPGRSAALDVCIASPNAARAQGDAA